MTVFEIEKKRDISIIYIIIYIILIIIIKPIFINCQLSELSELSEQIDHHAPTLPRY